MNITAKRLEQVVRKLESLIGEGVKGHHLLFSSGMIRDCFNGNNTEDLEDLLEQNMDAVHRALAETLRMKTIEEKREHIEGLPHELRDALIFGYFELVDGNILENGASLH